MRSKGGVRAVFLKAVPHGASRERAMAAEPVTSAALEAGERTRVRQVCGQFGIKEVGVGAHSSKRKSTFFCFCFSVGWGQPV